eukprot:COSAG02_NODE_4541_length_5234_cov_4.080818_4_plen_51_part_00
MAPHLELTYSPGAPIADCKYILQVQHDTVPCCPSGAACDDVGKVCYSSSN